MAKIISYHEIKSILSCDHIGSKNQTKWSIKGQTWVCCGFHCRFLVPGNTQKMMMNSGLEKIILKFHGGLQRYLLTCQANSAFLGRFFCTGQQQLWRPSWNFKIIFSRPLFIIIFKPKMVSNLRKFFFVYCLALKTYSEEACKDKKAG